MRDLLTGPDGEVSPALHKLAETFEVVDRPRSVLGWLQRSAGARLLASLVAANSEITHATFDALPQTKYLHHVRQAFVHVGILPERIEYLDRIGPWIDDILAGYPADDAQLVLTYAHWYVLRRARQRTRHHDFTYDASRRARTVIRVALELLTWLRKREKQLEDLQQHDIEEWLSSHPGRKSYLIDGFLKWANGHGLVDRIIVTAPPRDEPANFIDDDYRWQEFRRCLDDDHMLLPTRVAGALLFLYGLPPSRIITLRSEHIEQQGAETYLKVGNGRLPLPPKLAILINELRDCASNPSVLGRAHIDAGWLFHGKFPGRPLSVSAFRQRLRKEGVRNSRAVRNTALIALVSDLPASIVADLLGIHIETAARWSKYAKRDWIDYLAARNDDIEAERVGLNCAPPE
ncbi:hypothetical protein [Streptosporangium sp. NPDC006930]|uniref:hypothetical protein n=1 Tax=Streptosporangium sp. NPDC006930 TaxID=3154783 RepID=UPI00341B8634